MPKAGEKVGRGASIPRLEETGNKVDSLTIIADFPKEDTNTIFGYFTEPLLLKKWWPPEIEVVEPEVNGKFVLLWPKQNWVFRSVFTEFDPGKNLSFAWSWDHEPGANPTNVRIRFDPLEEIQGTRITLVHGTYGPKDTDQRQSHLDGWMFFLKKLQGIRN